MRTDHPAICYAFDVDDTRGVVVRSTCHKRCVQHQVVWEGFVDDNDTGWAQARASALFEAREGKAITTAAMPASQSITRWLSAPFPSTHKARKVLPALLDIQLPFPLETCQYQFPLIKRDNQQVKALAVIAQTEALEKRIEQCTEAGFDPIRLDHEALAIWTQSIADITPVSEHTRIVVYLARDHHVMIIGIGTSFVSAHSGQTGLDHLVADESTEPDPQVLTAFTNRMQHIIRANIPDIERSPVDLFWAGPGAANPTLCGHLEKSMTLEAPVLFQAHAEATSFLARGLATRALQPESEPTCNFRTGILIHPVTTILAQKQNKRFALSYLILCLLIIVLNAGWLQVLSLRTRQAKERVNKWAYTIAPSAHIQYGQELLDAQRAYEKSQVALQPFIRAFHESTPRQLEKILDVAEQHSIQLEGLSLRQDYISLQGASRQWADCEYITGILQEMGFTTGKPSRKDAGYDEKVHFAIEGTR